MSGVDVHRFVAGSKIRPAGSPTWSAMWPPTERRRPSGRVIDAAQNRFAPSLVGMVVIALVTGSHTCGSGLPVLILSQARTLPSRSRLRCTDTSGHVNSGDHRPT